MSEAGADTPASGHWLQRLGLASDPFARGALPAFYFAGAGRRYFLQQAVQQLHFGSGRVVVLGPEGAGKSALFRACVAELEGVADCAMTSAHEGLDAQSIGERLVAAAGLPRACAASEADLLAALERLVPEDTDPQPVVLAVDDAHLLDDDTLASCARLQAQSGGRIRLLLAGEPGLVDALDAVAEPPPFERLRLTPLTRDEVADYVLARLRAAGFEGPLPLDDLAIEALTAQSGGHPGALHALAPRLLSMPVATSPVAVARSMPVWHLLAASILLTTLVVAFFYMRDSSPVVRQIALFPPEEVPASAEPAPVSSSSSVPPRGEVAGSGSGSGSGPGAGAAATGSALAADTAPAPTQGAGAAAATARDPVRRDPVRAEAPVAQAPSAPSRGVATAPVREPGASPSRSTDEQALLQWPAEAFVVQLFAARERARVAAAVAGLEPRALIFETRLQGSPWFVAVSGPYTQREQASAAIPRLPETLREAGPWVRPVADIQQQIRARD